MRQPTYVALLLVAACALAGAARAFEAPPVAGVPESAETNATEFFEQQIRPVLADHCVACHGPKKQEGSLRLDSRARLLSGGDGGSVVDLAQPAASRLLKAIRRDDAELEMPPPPAARLTDLQIAAVERWVAAGAPWPSADDRGAESPSTAREHWAFQRVESHKPPTVRDPAWPTSPVDLFVLARLEAEGLTPAPTADRRTLVRRATYDLIGIAPREDEIAAFVADPDPRAFARLVDRLLDSPLYGQRWGRYWLDVARYADTKGYVRLKEERRFHYAFTYRDWVIRALNEDLPFDQFIEQQLAADLLPTADNRALAALGFLALGRQFTGNQQDIIDDRIDVVCRGLLGLTVTCARCHDHKYDPIPTADYYSLYGIFGSCEEPVVPPLTGPAMTDAASVEFERETQKRKQALDDYEPQAYRQLLNDFRRQAGQYLSAALAGHVPLQQPLPKVAGEIRQVVANRWVEFLSRRDARDPVFGPWHVLTVAGDDGFAPAMTRLVAGWNNSDVAAPGASVNRLVQQRLLSEAPASTAELANVYGKLLVQVHEQWQSLSRATTAAAAGALERLPDAAEEQLRQLLYAADSPVAVSLQEAFGEYLYDVPINDEITKRRVALAEHLANTAHAPPRAHTLVEMAAPLEPHILVRGNPGRPGRTVTRHLLTALQQGDASAPRPAWPAATARLELARAIASRDNPLASRVLVNRVWAHHFGAGLVRTPSNFGLRGQPPTHPDLLDYLAARFMEDGGSMKQLHRRIMLSSTYRQSSAERPDAAQLDPGNRWLWKMNRRRLDFEAMRDSLLAVADRLDTSLGGPSFDVTVPGANRRSVYALIDRQALPGLLPAFDFASPDTHSPERYTTVVPQQALFLMNGPFVVDVAKAFAARPDVRKAGTPAERIDRMVRIAWGRAASEQEIALALAFIASDSAGSAGDDSPGPALSTWEAFAQSLLLANEFIYVD